MPISRTEGYFENPLYHFLENFALSVGFKMKTLRKSVFEFTNSTFAVQITERSSDLF